MLRKFFKRTTDAPKPFEPPHLLRSRARVGLLRFLGSGLLALGLLLSALAVLAQETGALTRLTHSTPAGRDSELRNGPGLSDDGRVVVFHSDADFFNEGIVAEQFEVWRYDTTALTLTRLTRSNEGSARDSLAASVNGDGTKVVFRSDADLLGQGLPDEQMEIWLFDTSTMTYTRITTATPGNRRSFFPIINDDGTKIVFESDSDFFGEGILQNQLELWLYDTVALTLTRITTASAPARISIDPTITADGSKIAFASRSDFFNQGLGGQYEIWLYETATKALTRVSPATGFNRDSFAPSISANGRQIAFHSDTDFLGQGIADEQNEIWLYDTATMTVTRVTTASEPGRDSQNPSLTADGTKIAFESDSDFLGQGIPAGQFEIWLYDTAAMTYTRMTTASEATRQSVRPMLSADGYRLAFQSDSDFLGQGIPGDQNEIWLQIREPQLKLIYLPVVLK